MIDGFGFRAARLLMLWMRTKAAACSVPNCSRRAMRISWGGGETKIYCDGHGGSFADLRDAELIRETEALIDEANGRPSTRRIPIGVK